MILSTVILENLISEMATIYRKVKMPKSLYPFKIDSHSFAGTRKVHNRGVGFTACGIIKRKIHLAGMTTST